MTLKNQRIGELTNLHFQGRDQKKNKTDKQTKQNKPGM